MRIGATGWLFAAALAAALLAGLGRERARAEGAIAIGTTGEGTTADVVRDGIAFGLSINVSKDMAGEIAVKRCRTFEARKAAERCKVVATFSGECFAIAYDPKPGTPGAGWGIGPDQLVANQKAVAMCEQAAGPARKGYCQVERFGCDTTGPKPVPRAKPEATPDAQPTPGTDAKSTPDGSTQPKDAKPSEEAQSAKEAKEAKEDAKGTKQDTKDADARAHSVTVAPAPSAAEPVPKPPATPPVAKPRTAAEPAATWPRGLAAPLLPVLAMAGVGLAYAAGQHLRGRLKGGLDERQIITGGGLAIAAAIAVKLLDMAGVGSTVAAALAGLIALGAAILG